MGVVSIFHGNGGTAVLSPAIVAAPPTDLLGKLQNFYHFTCGKGWRSPTRRKTGDIEMFHGNNMIEREHI